MNKKAYIFDCYDDYEIRLKYIKSVLEQCGYQTVLYLADFNHFTKSPVEKFREDAKYIHVLPYKKNLSAERILSHIKFAKDCLSIQKKNPADLVYVMTPPNFLAKEFGQFRKSHPSFKLIFDICDLWPETFPSNKAKSILAVPFSVWSGIRNKWLKYADSILFECNLFKDKLSSFVSKDKSHTLYLCKDPVVTDAVSPTAECLSFAYLGSINHIIDIENIVKFLVEVKKRRTVCIHIIGDGENRKPFIDLLERNSIRYCYHGLVFDQEEKRKILNQCHYGFNMMKDSVCVGLTMKSLDYFAYDLPLVNSIPADTWQLVEEYDAGFNLSPETLQITADQLSSLSEDEYLKKKENVLQIQTVFTVDAFCRKFQKVVSSL